MQTSLNNHHKGDLPYAEEVNNTLLPASNTEKDEKESTWKGLGD
jgi:hypothetical protein